MRGWGRREIEKERVREGVIETYLGERWEGIKKFLSK